MPEFCYMDQVYDKDGHVIVNQEYSRELKTLEKNEEEITITMENNEKLVGKTDKVKFVDKKSKDKEEGPELS